MTKLSDTQTTILSAAAARENHSLLPVPASLKAKGAALNRALAALIKRGFASEAKAAREESTWRSDQGGQRIGLTITQDGLAAIGAAIGVEAQETPNTPGTGGVSAPKPPSGKLGTILTEVERTEGATLTDLANITGWQPHTTRAALTRLRQRGYDIRLETNDGRKAYRLAGKAA